MTNCAGKCVRTLKQSSKPGECGTLLGKIQQPIRVLYEDRVDTMAFAESGRRVQRLSTTRRSALLAYAVSIKRVRRRSINTRLLKTDYCAGSSLYHRMGNLSPKARKRVVRTKTNDGKHPVPVFAIPANGIRLLTGEIPWSESTHA